MNLTPETRRELTALLKRIKNPKSVPLTLSIDPDYKYYLLEDGTYRVCKRYYLSSGELRRN